MIFAEIESDKDVESRHSELAYALHSRFTNIRSGLQADSWFLIIGEDGDVMVDSLTSMRHQIKSSNPGAHVEEVIGVLGEVFNVRVFDSPVSETHEDEH